MQVSIAGVIIETKLRKTKRGNPFGQYVIEDYSGKIKFTLFNEKFEQFHKFLEKDTCVWLEGTFNDLMNEFRVQAAGTLEQKFQRIAEINIIYNALSFAEQDYKDLKALCNEYITNSPSAEACKFKISFAINGNGKKVTTSSKKYFLKKEKALFKELFQHNISFKLKIH